MKLGILVNTDRNLKHIIGIATSAVRKGHDVLIFVMDEGVRFIENEDFINLSKVGNISLSFCDYSAQILNVSKDKVTDDIVCGSQFNNAVMNRDADRVIVL